MLVAIIFSSLLCIVSPLAYALPVTDVFVDSLNYVYVPVSTDVIKFKVKTKGEVHILLCNDMGYVRNQYHIHLTNKHSLIKQNEHVLVNVSTSKIFGTSFRGNDFTGTFPTSSTNRPYRTTRVISDLPPEEEEEPIGFYNRLTTTFNTDENTLPADFQEFIIFRLREVNGVAVSRGSEPYPFLLWTNSEKLRWPGEINYVGVSIVAAQDVGQPPYDSTLPSLDTLNIYENGYGNTDWQNYVQRHPSYKVYNSLTNRPKVTEGHWTVESITADNFANLEVGNHFNVTERSVVG